MKKEKLWKSNVILAVFGIILAIYLLYLYFLQKESGICNINGLFNCREMTFGSLGLIYGIPVSLVGLIGYIVILYSSLKRNINLGLIMSIFGTVFCLRITYLEIFVVKIICPLCMVCQIIMLVIVIQYLLLKYPRLVRSKN